ncbi:hypothetical protein N5079_17170 [Planotetraspora sp. A-T 1434]|uniref:hypothetical protein n=1 Tax=Planotetraspora sp. A-T 1434 TaxID=2979219 RepID=UPI0021C2404A|nr:hypothetical protein [Planotetraspora sp. A-T 1434]MCT9931937.1 hypothetical protein [Planotetraspora sp. A-T 1434]
MDPQVQKTALESAPIERDGDRAGLQPAAEAVRELVHRHLEHEEPLLCAQHLS